jgi:nitroimidazol reductase NimA-like FMN-containing flavoprotein (pyridoxamine 5'-phosphate oxidase superfamily)
MASRAPVADLDRRFSSPRARASSWRNAEQQLREAGVWWLSTVTPEARPHVVPLIAVWLDGALYFATGEDERKAKNLAQNPHVSVTTGSNDLSHGFDVVVEGEAKLMTEDAKVRRIADAYAMKYGEGWRLPGLDGVVLFEVTPSKAFGFGRRDGHIGPPSGEGELFTQTRWRFQAQAAVRRSQR